MEKFIDIIYENWNYITYFDVYRMKNRRGFNSKHVVFLKINYT